MRWVRRFLQRVKGSQKRNAKARNKRRGILTVPHRGLGYESLEDRRLLSVSLPTGLGDWTFYISSTESNLGKSTAAALFSYEYSQGVRWIVVKAQDGTSTGQWGYSASVVTAAHNAGLKIYAYAYVYGGSNEAAELSTTKSIIASTSPDGFVIDAEVEYQGQPTEATAYAGGIKAAYPNLFLAYAPFPIIDDHESFPYIQFGEYCDAVMPQAYFETGSGYTPSSMLSEIDSQWSKWDNTWATGGFASSVKPIIPICQAYNDQYFTDNGSDLSGFVTDFKNDASPATAGGYQGVSFFDADHETSGMRSEIAASSIGISAPTLVSPGTGTSPGSTLSGTSQTLKWNKVTNATSYTLQVTNVTTSTTSTYTVSSGSTTSYSLTGLIGGDAYSWNMYSDDGPYDGETYQSAISSTDYFTIQPKPGVPTGLAASQTGIQSTSVSWNTVSGATSYILDRSTSPGSGYAQVYSGATASYADSGLLFGTTYYYEVSASNATGSSAFSSDVSATTLAGVPTGLSALTTGVQSISVSWGTVTGATSYILDRSTSPSSGYAQVYSGATAQYADSALQFGTIYYYEVSSSDGTASSAFSSAVSATTQSGVPTGLSATATGSATTSVSWNTVSSVTGYTLDRSTTPGSGYAQVYSGTTASFGDSGLQPNTPYYYEVRSYTSTGNSAFSSAASTTTLRAAPAGLSTTTTGTQTVSMSWSPVSGATGYTLQRSTSSGSGYVQVYSGANGQYADSGLQPNTPYYYEVRAYSSTWNSAFSSAVSATTSVLATWSGSGSDNSWSDTSNWGTAVPASADTSLFSAASYTRQPTISLAASIGAVWNTGSGALTIGGTGPLTLYGTTVNSNASTGIEMDSGAGALTVNAPLVLQSNQQWINNSSNSITVNGSISGAGSLTKAGSGSVILSGANNYSGGTVVTAGKLIINSAGSLPAGSSLTIGASTAQGAVFGAFASPAMSALDAVFAEYGRS